MTDFLYVMSALQTAMVTKEHEGWISTEALSSGNPIPMSVIARSSESALDKARSALPPAHEPYGWSITITAISSVPEGAT